MKKYLVLLSLLLGSFVAGHAQTDPNTCAAGGPCINLATQVRGILSQIHLPNPITLNVNGNAATATALQNTPTQCTVGTYPLGIDVHGNVVNCTSISTTGGTVTSVNLSLPNIFTVTGTPITSSGTFNVSLNTVAGHTYFGNNTGSPAVPVFVQPLFSDLSGVATKAQLPGTVVHTDQGNFYSTGTQDFSNATLLRLRNVAGSPITGSNGEVGYSLVDLNWHIFGNAKDNLIAVFPSASLPTNGNCVQWVVTSGVVTLGQAAAACGSGSGGGATFQVNNVNLTTQSVVNFLNSNPFNGLTLTVTNTAGGNVQFGFSGTLGNAGLTNSSTTVNNQLCALGGTCTFGAGTVGHVLRGNGSFYVDGQLNYTDLAGTPTLEYQTVKANGTAQTQRPNLNLVNGTNATVTCADNAGTNSTDCTVSASAAAGSRLDQITPATNSNSINNTVNAQSWLWNAGAGINQTNFTIGESGAASGTGDVNLWAQTLTTSTAIPFKVTAQGTANGIQVSTTGVLAAVGSGHVNADQCNSSTCVNSVFGRNGVVTAANNDYSLDQINSPAIGKTFTLGNANFLQFGDTASTATGTNNLVTITDANSNTGTGSVLAVKTGTGSAAHPLTVTAGGTVNGVQMSTTGVLAAIGTGHISADQCNGVTCGTVTNGAGLTSGQLVTGAGSNAVQVGNLSGDVTTSGSTVATVGKVNGVTYPAAPSTNTVPVITGANTVTYETTPIAAGGTGSTTQSGAATAILPAATTAGSLAFWNGSQWNIFAGNTVGTNFLQENSSGVLSWNSTAATVNWNGIGNPTGNLSLSMGANTSTFNTTTAVNNFFEWANNTAATSGTAQSSPLLSLCGQGWEGATPANTQDCWQLQNVIGNGSNPSVTLAITDSGGSTGTKAVQVPSLQTTGSSQGLLALTASTTAPSSFPANSYGWLAPNSASIATPWFFQPSSTTGPAATGPMLVGAVSSNISPISYGTLSNSANSKLATTTGTLNNGNLASWNASGDVIDSGVAAANTATSPVTLTSGIPVLGNGTKSIALKGITTDSGAANAYVVNPATAISTLTAGIEVRFKTSNANTGASTLNVSSLGVQNLTKNGATALVSGDILANAVYDAVYDGAEWQLRNPSSSGGGGSGTVSPATANQVAVYTGSTTVGGNTGLTFSSNTLNVGVAASATGGVVLNNGGVGGAGVTIQNNAATAAYNLNLPATAGSANAPLLSGGGGANPMVYGSRSGNTTSFATTSGTLTNGHCVSLDANGNITDAGAACGAGGGGSGSGPNFGTSFTNQTQIVIAGTAHNMGTKNLVVACYDNGSPAASIQPASYTVNTSTFDVTVNFNTAQSGYCVVNGSGPSFYAANFSSSTSWSIPAATHGLGGPDLSVRVYDSGSGTRNEIQPGNVSIASNGDVTVTFAVAQAGRVVITQ